MKIKNLIFGLALATILTHAANVGLMACATKPSAPAVHADPDAGMSFNFTGPIEANDLLWSLQSNVGMGASIQSKPDGGYRLVVYSLNGIELILPDAGAVSESACVSLEKTTHLCLDKLTECVSTLQILAGDQLKKKPRTLRVE